MSNTNDGPDPSIGEQNKPSTPHHELTISQTQLIFRRLTSFLGRNTLFVITCFSLFALFFIFWFIVKEAIPFFQLQGITEFFASTHWYPSRDEPEFGAAAIFFGSGIVTLGAILFAVPLGIPAAICLSDLLPFNVRQIAKPIIELLAAIPSVAYGFFALVIFAPILQNHGGVIIGYLSLLIGIPILILLLIVLGDVFTHSMSDKGQFWFKIALWIVFAPLGLGGLFWLKTVLSSIQVDSGTNAMNAAVILGIMALPTIVSVSEDALNAVGRELREGGYALGATRAETLLLIIVPAASSGIFAAVMLGIMRAIGETMVVWMASGNAAQIPDPFYNFFEPIRTLTATIAGDMGEADQTTGSSRYHVLFAMAFSLLTFSFLCNLISEWFVRRQQKKFSA